MKSSTRTIMAFIVLILTTACFAATQDPPEPPGIKIITISGSVGVAGVEMQGLPGNPITDSNGRYSATVESGWTGIVTPMKRGCNFRPSSKTYSAVTKNLTNQDYVVEPMTFIISGKISKDDIGVSGVILTGFPGNAVTDEDGNYSASVPYGWSGTVKPTKKGYNFRSASISNMGPTATVNIYRAVTKNLTNQNYISSVKTFKISGATGVAGVLMRGLPGDPLTDRDGTYSVIASYGWTGIVTPIKEGYKFVPPNRTYADITKNLDNQDFWPTQIDIAPMFDGSVSRRVLIVPTSEVAAENFEQTTEDMLVMLHIFDEKMKIKDEPDSIRGVFRNYGDIFGRDNKTSKAIYIQDYGVLFLMEVDLPLVFSTEPQQVQPEQTEQEDADPVWQQAKKQVFSPKDDVRGMISDAHPKDIQQRVEQLKNELIGTLKHASNIRHTKPDDWIILSVTGWSESTGSVTPLIRYQMMENRTGTRSRSRTRGGMGGGYGGGGMSGQSRGSGGFGGGMTMSGGGFGGGMMMGGRGFGSMEAHSQMGPSSAAVLTISARKSDVDAFAKDELSFEQFRQKINIFVY